MAKQQEPLPRGIKPVSKSGKQALVETPPSEEQLLDEYLRASAIVQSINANLPKASQLPEIPQSYVFRKRDREAVSTALHAAFELAGGVPYLVAFAQSQPDKFIPIWAKLLPSETETSNGVNITFTSAIPANELDKVTIDVTGRVISTDDLPE